MKRPYCIEGDEQKRTLAEFVEQIALGVADEVVNGARTETIQTECRILDSLTNALMAIKY